LERKTKPEQAPVTGLVRDGRRCSALPRENLGSSCGQIAYPRRSRGGKAR
jgi:hypothetical protein